MFARAALALALGAAALTLGACRFDTSSPAAADPSDESVRFANGRDSLGAYVGDAACATCHEDLWRSYQSHGMARAVSRPADSAAAAVPDGAPVYHAATRLYYRSYHEGDRLLQEEYRLGPDGRKTHTLVREAAYTVGSGTAAHTFLAQGNGWLYQLPLTYYTQARKWDLSPGYAADNARFDRVVGDRCVACHDAFPRAVPFTNGKFEGALPLGVSCERCHGPGARHVAARQESPDVEGPDLTITNPRHLSFERRLDVCQQCHLQGDVMLLREGESAFGFRPGRPFEAHQALFSVDRGADSEGAISVISHAERMQRSACFLETKGTPRALECVTCHNPHEGFRDKGPDYFNRTCRTCHAPAALQAAVAPEARPQHTATANCFSCHMPKVVSEARHSSFTDHWIRVVHATPRPPSDSVPAGSVRLVPYFARDREGPDAKVYEGMAYVVYGRQRGDQAALERGVALLGEALAGGPAGRHGEARYVRGFALLQLGRAGEALPDLEAAASDGPGVPERLNTLAQAYEASGRAAEAGPLYERALAVQPALASIRVNLGRLLEAQGRLAEAADQYRRAGAEQPWLAAAHFNLGTVLLRQSDLAGAEAALQTAVGLQPDNAEARGNLGLLYASRGETGPARVQFEAAAEGAPTNPTALGNLGAFLLNEGAERDRAANAARAKPLLERAVALNPGYVDGLVNLALAHLRLGEAPAAAQRAQQALALRPDDPRPRQILDALGGG